MGLPLAQLGAYPDNARVRGQRHLCVGHRTVRSGARVCVATSSVDGQTLIPIEICLALSSEISNCTAAVLGFVSQQVVLRF